MQGFRQGIYACSLSLFLSTLSPAFTLYAQEADATAEDSGATNEDAPSESSLPNDIGHPSAFTPKYNPDRTRSVFWAPLFSLFLPGLDQWMEGQYGYATAYTGVALIGYQIAGYNRQRLEKEYDTWEYESQPTEVKENRQAFGERERRLSYGSQMAFASGSFSAYHAFRTAVPGQQKIGRFEFLKESETPGELLLAPFRFDYLKRPSTWIPLGVIAGLSALSFGAELGENSEYEKRSLTRSDYFYTMGVSYAAGTHEELLFRGWLLPLTRQMTGGDLSANLITTGAFALAHLGSTKMPVPQALLGFHLGWVTQQNNWTLSESIFIHTWWDVFAFLMQYELQKKDPRAAPAALWLPPIQLAF